ncbi:MAG: hypothetical protein KDC26_12775 [Armatimonadetes bacterium]|nr:hypothetical protein [Armatimonadota bacterium]
MSDATETYRAAMQFWDAEDYENALPLFQFSYEQKYHILTEFRMGQCLFALGRLDEIKFPSIYTQLDGWAILAIKTFALLGDSQKLNEWMDYGKVSRGKKMQEFLAACNELNLIDIELSRNVSPQNIARYRVMIEAQDFPVLLKV